MGCTVSRVNAGSNRVQVLGVGRADEWGNHDSPRSGRTGRHSVATQKTNKSGSTLNGSSVGLRSELGGSDRAGSVLTVDSLQRPQDFEAAQERPKPMWIEDSVWRSQNGTKVAYDAAIRTQASFRSRDRLTPFTDIDLSPTDDRQDSTRGLHTSTRLALNLTDSNFNDHSRRSSDSSYTSADSGGTSNSVKMGFLISPDTRSRRSSDDDPLHRMFGHNSAGVLDSRLSVLGDDDVDAVQEWSDHILPERQRQQPLQQGVTAEVQTSPMAGRPPRPPRSSAIHHGIFPEHMAPHSHFEWFKYST